MARLWFIGCACDPAFVDLTKTLLSSLDTNGQVGSAVVVVADFGLSPADRDALRTSAGALGEAMRFVSVPRNTPHVPVLPAFAFPFPMLGRFVIPKLVDDGARLVVLDSDMIVNHSLRPLFEMDLEGHALAAIHDPLSEEELGRRNRQVDPDYLNTGLMVIDVDRWRALDLSDRAMVRLAAYAEKPEWPDQDALNEVVGGDWLRLDRRWNLFYAGDARQFTTEEYSSAPIVHFAGAKPDQALDHPALPLYRQHLEEVRRKEAWRAMLADKADRDFIATCYEVLLGRELNALDALAGRGSETVEDALRLFLNSREFNRKVIAPLRHGKRSAGDPTDGGVSIRQRFWAADKLPVLPDTQDRVLHAADRRELLTSLLADRRLMAIAGLEPSTPEPTPAGVP